MDPELVLAANKNYSEGFDTLRQWWLILAVIGIWLALIAFLVFLLLQVRYRIGPKHFKVMILGIPVRRVRLDNIRNLSTRPVWFGEKWHNLLFPRLDRILVIQKKRGLLKNFVVTPENRFVFKTELDRAIRAYLSPLANPSGTDSSAMNLDPAASPEVTEPTAPSPSVPSSSVP